jgi:flagellar hook-basal body complex protein FliE
MINAVSSISSSLANGAIDALRSSTATGPGAAEAAATSFGDMLAQVSTGAVQTLRTAEATSIAGMQGKASVQQVVDTVMSAQETLQTALSIRDKAVAAFQQITQMAI